MSQEKISELKKAKKIIMLKALAAKKAAEAKVTFSISIERRVKDALDQTSKESKLSGSFLINEILKNALMADQ
jgi:hypothetical protein